MKESPKIAITRRRYRSFSETSIGLSGPVASLDLHIRGRFSSRERRAIALAFFRHIRPWLEYFRSAYIHPMEETAFDYDRAEARGVNLFRARPILKENGEVDELGELGFKIRMRRLELGLSQKELAEKVGLSASHLSEIERGASHPHRATLQALSFALKVELIAPKRAFQGNGGIPRQRKVYFRS